MRFPQPFVCRVLCRTVANVDSMGFVVLITYLEEHFGVKTTDTDLVEDNFESINAITDFIIRKKGN